MGKETKQQLRKKNSVFVNKEIKEEIKKYLKKLKMKKQHSKNLLDLARAVLRGNIMVIQVFFQKQKKSQINNLNPPSNRIRRKKKIKGKAQTQQKGEKKNQSKNKQNREQKTIEKINETKSWFFK